MTYRSLLVFLDQDRRADARTGYALRIAQALDCHLVGAAPTGLMALPSDVSVESQASLAEFAELAWDALRRRAEKSRSAFAKACDEAAMPSFETICEHADKSVSLVRLAHCSDLVLLSQADPGDPAHASARQLVEEVVIGSARPTLILPFAGQFDSVATRVLVAWDDSREAARAVSDALPLLRLAQRVQVECWVAPDDREEPLAERLDTLRRWLMWQGVSAETQVVRTGMAPADAMLSRAADVDADLIVMGAYGHARWRERVLGGATRDILGSMTVPVLMSH